MKTLSNTVELYLEYLKINVDKFPTIPGFKIWCIDNNLTIENEDLEYLNLYCENEIINYVFGSKQQSLLVSLMTKLLDKYHNYSNTLDNINIPPIKIELGQMKDLAKNTVKEELKKLNNKNYD